MFAPGSRAEVPIVGRISRDRRRPGRVAGQVDRLVVTDDAVLIADYKTDRRCAAAGSKRCRRYVAQLALYRAVLARLYPDKAVRAALIFTAGPVLIEIPAAGYGARNFARSNEPAVIVNVTLR